MRTNGFALFRGEGAPKLAREAARRVNRRCNGLLVSTGEGFRELEGARIPGKEVALAFSLERGGFPLVHGFVEDPAAPKGEFSLLGKGEAGFYGERDALGTRGLWVVKSGRGAGSIASDYRLLRAGAALLPPGTVYTGGRARKVAGIQGRARTAPSFDEAAKELAPLIEESVRRRVVGGGRVAVSFSGGLDSSILAMVASKHAEVVLCSAYAAGSRDEGQSARAADLLGLRLETALLDEQTLAKRSVEAELPPGEATVMDRALWCIYSTTSELARRSKAHTILLGQLADELFGGYMKYAISAREEGPVGRGGDDEEGRECVRGQGVPEGRGGLLGLLRGQVSLRGREDRGFCRRTADGIQGQGGRTQGDPPRRRSGARPPGGAGLCPEEGGSIQLRRLEAPQETVKKAPIPFIKANPPTSCL